MKKRIIAMLMSVVLMIGILPVAAIAVDEETSGKCGDNLTWTLDEEGTLTISGEGEMYDYYADSPEWLQLDVKAVVIEEGVTNIGANAFSNCVSIERVVISETVKVIRDYAFSDCVNMNEIEMPNGVTSIGYWAFGFCESLTSIRIPASVTEIDVEAFVRCHNLEEIVVDENNEYFCNDESGVLYNKDMSMLVMAPIAGIDGIYTVPDGVTEISFGAFAYCEGLTEIVIPNSVTNIYDDVFRSCHGLTEVKLPSRLTRICQYTFIDCVNLTKVEMPDGLKTIDSYAFYLCESLSEVTIPNSVIEIGTGVFQDCDSLVEITVPDSVTRVSLWAFDSCDNLHNVTFEGNAPDFSHEYVFTHGATVFYPRNDETWNEAMEYISDEVIWSPYNADKQQIGDLNGDGDITNADLVMLARIIVGL